MTGSTSAQPFPELSAAPAAPMEGDKVSPGEIGQQMETEEPSDTEEPIGGRSKVLPGSSAAFKRVCRAHEVLTKVDDRRQYDLSLTGSSKDTEEAARLVKEARAELAKHRAQHQAAAEKSVQKLPHKVLQLSHPLQAMRRKALSDLRSSQAEVILQHVAKVRELALKDESAAVRSAAVKTLLKLSVCNDPTDFEREALPTVLAKLEDVSSVVRNAVVDGCAGIKAVLAAHAPAIVAKLEHSDGSVRRVAVEMLGTLEPAVLATHAPAIVAKLEDSDGNVRRLAAETLGKLEPAVLATHAPAIVAKLEDSVERVRLWAVETLRKLEMLGDLALDPAVQLRMQAVETKKAARKRKWAADEGEKSPLADVDKKLIDKIQRKGQAKAHDSTNL